MRGNLFRVLLTAFAALVVGAGAATAAPLARYVGHGGPVPSLGCAATTIAGDVGLAGALGDVDHATYENCRMYIVRVDVRPRGPWQLSPVTTTAYHIDDIEVAISGPGCAGVVEGSAEATYDSAAGVLTVDSQATVVTFVDPVNDCLGLVNEGEQLPVLADAYDVVIAV